MENCLALWAKKKEKDGIFYWLSLKRHLEDTREVMGLLWEHWLSEGQRIYIADSMMIEEDEAKFLVMFIGAIHDIGKATPAFQIQRGFQNSEDLDLLLMEKLEQEGFSGIKDLELTDRGKTPCLCWRSDLPFSGYQQRNCLYHRSPSWSSYEGKL